MGPSSQGDLLGGILASSPFLQMIHQRLIQNGKKKLAYKILQKSFNHIQNKTQQDPLLIIEKAIRNVTPSVAVQTRRIRGSVYPIPIEIPLERGVPKGIRWIIIAAKKRKRSSTRSSGLPEGRPEGRPDGQKGRAKLRQEVVPSTLTAAQKIAAQPEGRSKGRKVKGEASLTASKFSLNLANEFIDASKKIGSAFYKKEEIQKIANSKSKRK
uniref:Ribosomal protein S7 n=1 Tax=Rhipiliopsis peltata TaxID=2320810 RepID=A0A386B1B7_9CHLO|nr:ribosomal protein S7 [Rhipiliopsis peltata]AYC65480.1 ribosomal protein S7 [Rhipiliopsis peltata]